jgi:leucyl/phenylalanyl-tRNA---protein transferase
MAQNSVTEPLSPSLLLKAYATGIFPMAETRDAPSIYWVEPKWRGVLPLDGFHLSRSLAKTLKSETFSHSVNLAFGDVVAACAESKPGREGTWINDQIFASVMQLHALGHAHSVECWSDGELVGGLYGISLGRAFFGESMFSRATDASKAALAHLVARLRAGGYTLLDCQFITPHLQSLGAIEISRDDYQVSLSSSLGDRAGDFLAFDGRSDSVPLPPRTTVVCGPVSGKDIVQALVQTS